MTDHNPSGAPFSPGFSPGFQIARAMTDTRQLPLPINCVLADQQPLKAASTLLTGAALDSFPFK